MLKNRMLCILRIVHRVFMSIPMITLLMIIVLYLSFCLKYGVFPSLQQENLYNTMPLLKISSFLFFSCIPTSMIISAFLYLLRLFLKDRFSRTIVISYLFSLFLYILIMTVSIQGVNLVWWFFD